MWTIHEIEALTEREAADMALETMEYKGHNIYFVDFGEYFGYSALVYVEGRQARHTNEYELHWKQGETRESLHARYCKNLKNKLFAPEDFAAPLASHDEYRRKSEYLRDVNGERRENISIFCICRNEAERAAKLEQVKGMYVSNISFAYYHDLDFIEYEKKLAEDLEKAKAAMQHSAEYYQSAFLHEMYNHEYAYNCDADYDVLSVFGTIQYDDDCTLDDYFNKLHFTDEQRQAYRAARRQYMQENPEIYN